MIIPELLSALAKQVEILEQGDGSLAGGGLFEEAIRKCKNNVLPELLAKVSPIFVTPEKYHSEERSFETKVVRSISASSVQRIAKKKAPKKKKERAAIQKPVVTLPVKIALPLGEHPSHALYNLQRHEHFASVYGVL